MSNHEIPAIVYACRRGLLYEQKQTRETSVITASEEPVAVEIIQQFRGKIYGESGSEKALTGGKNVHPSDAKSYHVLVLDRFRLVGAARYERLFNATHSCWVELGGFAIVPDMRGTRIVLMVLNKVKELAGLFGDHKFFAHASVQYGSSSILKKMGGKPVANYWNPGYERDVEVLEIHI